MINLIPSKEPAFLLDSTKNDTNPRHSSGAFSTLRALLFERVRVLLGKKTVCYVETRNGILSFSRRVKIIGRESHARERETCEGNPRVSPSLARARETPRIRYYRSPAP